MDLVTLGETMVSFIPIDNSSIIYANNFMKKIAGAESNVAIGLSKLGKKTGWISKLGCDIFGDFVIRELKAEGVDVSKVSRCSSSTGVMFKQFNQGFNTGTGVYYYRKNSAASCLGPGDLDCDYIKNTKILHLSGITAMISESAKECVLQAFKIAKENNVLVSFDPNIRQKLWDPVNDKETMLWLLNNSDIALLGLDEAQQLYGTKEIDEVVDILRSHGVSRIAIKDGSNGSVVADMDDIYEIPTANIKVVDTVGAGDAYNSGFLYGVLESFDLKTCGEIGTILGACAVSNLGDTEGLPTLEQLNSILNNTVEILR